VSDDEEEEDGGTSVEFDAYARGLEEGKYIGRDQGFTESLILLVLAHETTAAEALAAHYRKILDEEDDE
jgi:hypothetical protein